MRCFRNQQHCENARSNFLAGASRIAARAKLGAFVALGIFTAQTAATTVQLGYNVGPTGGGAGDPLPTDTSLGMEWINGNWTTQSDGSFVGDVQDLNAGVPGQLSVPPVGDFSEGLTVNVAGYDSGTPVAVSGAPAAIRPATAGSNGDALYVGDSLVFTFDHDVAIERIAFAAGTAAEKVDIRVNGTLVFDDQPANYGIASPLAMSSAVLRAGQELVVEAAVTDNGFHVAALWVSYLAPLRYYPNPVFSFEASDPWTAVVKGVATPPSNTNLPTLTSVSGGVAAQFGGGTCLVFDAPTQYDKDQGSLVIWAQLNPQFGEVGPFTERLFTEVSTGTTMDQMWCLLYQNSLRFDPADSAKSWGIAQQAKRWAPGTWHQIAVTWKAEKGFIIWLDGKRAAQPFKKDGSSFFNDWTSWAATELAEQFVIGAKTEAGDQQWRGLISKVEVYDAVLSESEIKAIQNPVDVQFPLATPRDLALYPNTVQAVTVEAEHTHAVSLEGVLSFSIVEGGGGTVATGQSPTTTLPVGAVTSFPFTLPALTPGEYVWESTWTSVTGSRSWTTTLMVMPVIRPPGSPGSVTRTEVASWHAFQGLSGLATRGGHVTQRPSDLGSVVEAGESRYDTFVVPFEITNPDRLHIAVIRYPDDRLRSMDVSLIDRLGSNDPQLQTGIFAGGEYPNSGLLQEVELRFWPRSTQQALSFMTTEDLASAGIVDFTIFELSGDAATAEVMPYSGSEGSRRLGQFFEDPQLERAFGTDIGEEAGFFTAGERLFQVMEEQGQDLLYYPVVWYEGPLYDSVAEPMSFMNSRAHPGLFPQYLLRRVHQLGGGFLAGFHPHFLPTLTAGAETNAARVAAGAETIHQVKSDGTLCLNTVSHQEPPVYNPLDPTYQAAFLKLVDEFMARFGTEPALEGLALRLSIHKPFWFGTGSAGYNDCNIAAFETDTSISIPVSPTAIDRFSLRYDWLQANAWETWIAWRCQRIHDFWNAIVDRIHLVRPDVRLFVDASFLDWRNPYDPSNHDQRLREAGLDTSLYSDDSRIVLGVWQLPSDYRYQCAKEGRGSADARANLLDSAAVAPWQSQPSAFVTALERYHETAIGADQPISSPNAGETFTIPWRVSQIPAPGFHALEGPVAAMNSLDPILISRGGIRNGILGWENHARSFAQNFRALPAVKMTAVSGFTDPVLARQFDGAGGTVFYLLNRLPFQVEGSIQLDNPSALRDSLGGIPSDVIGGQFALAPYELRTFTGSHLIGGTFAPVPSALAWLQNREQSIATSSTTLPSGQDASAEVSTALGLAQTNRWPDFLIQTQKTWHWTQPRTSHGTPHSWLETFGLTSFGNHEMADALDTDGDGLKTFEEYITGTSPSDGREAINHVLSILPSGADCRLEWDSVPERLYRIWTSPDLVTWKEIGSTTSDQFTFTKNSENAFVMITVHKQTP